MGTGSEFRAGQGETRAALPVIMAVLTGQQEKGVLWRRKRRLHYIIWNSSTILPQGSGALGFISKPGPTQRWTPSCERVCPWWQTERPAITTFSSVASKSWVTPGRITET